VPSHNLYLQTLSETGVIGALLFFVPLISLVLASLRTARLVTDGFWRGVLVGGACSLFSVLVHGVVDSLFQPSASFTAMFWVTVGILLATTNSNFPILNAPSRLVTTAVVSESFSS
jgi:O-antigen ligase